MRGRERRGWRGESGEEKEEEGRRESSTKMTFSITTKLLGSSHLQNVQYFQRLSS